MNKLIKTKIYSDTLFIINGKVIFTSLPRDILFSSLKELEIRHMVVNEFNLIFVSLDNGQKVFSRTIDIP